MSLPPITTVDFLPADFHAMRRRRRARRGRWGLAIAFLLLTAAGLLGNRVQYAHLEAESKRIQPQAEAVADLERSLAQLQQEITAAELDSDVRSLLRLKAASSRLIAIVTSRLPDGVALLELQIRNEKPTGVSQPVSSGAGKDEEQKPPAEIDLERLRADHSRQIVTVRGFAPTDGTISRYLENLRRAGPFDDVQLLFTDRYPYLDHEFRTFALRLRIRETAPRPEAKPAGGAV
jgi:hypothetical protein